MKENIFKVVTALIFLAIFNLVFFLLDGPANPVNWVSYGFITFAYLFLLATPLFGGNAKGLTVLQASLWLRATGYFFLELAVGVVFFVISPQEMTWPLIIQAVILAIFLIMQFMSVLANKATDESIRKQRVESQFIRQMADKLRSRLNMVEDADLKKELTPFYQSLNSTSIESFPEAQDAELQLKNSVEVLCMNIEDGADAEQIRKALRRAKAALQDRNAAITNARMY